jgi:hypothetical protein
MSVPSSSGFGREPVEGGGNVYRRKIHGVDGIIGSEITWVIRHQTIYDRCSIGVRIESLDGNRRLVIAEA